MMIVLLLALALLGCEGDLASRSAQGQIDLIITADNPKALDSVQLAIEHSQQGSSARSTRTVVDAGAVAALSVNAGTWDIKVVALADEITRASGHSSITVKPGEHIVLPICLSCQYTVRFDPNGGDGPAPPSITVTANAAYGALPTVAKGGYAFTGWHTAAEGGELVTEETVVTTEDHHTLYAQWDSAVYEIRYDANGALSGSIPATHYKKSDSAAAVADFAGGLAMAGYRQVGWNTQADGSGGTYLAGSTYSANDSVVLWAQWAANQYTVTFDHQGGSGGSTCVEATYAQLLDGALVAPARDGHTFAGYTDQPSGGTVYYDGGMQPATVWDKAADATLYAQWSPVAYTVTYDMNGKNNDVEGLPPDRMKLHDQDLVIPGAGSMTRIGYTFGSWNTKANGTGVSYAEGSVYDQNSVLTLYAQWDPLRYLVHYEANGDGVVHLPAAHYKIHGSTLSIAKVGSMSREGYLFVNWNTEPDGSGVKYSASGLYRLDSPLTLYAQWEPHVITYTITYAKGAGGSGTPPSAQTKIHDGPGITVAGPGVLVRAGHEFGGWNTRQDGGGIAYAPGDTYSANSALYLYAQWKPIVYRIEYVANGGGVTALPDALEREYDTNLTIAAQGDMKRKGYRLTGWNTRSDGSGSAYAIGASVKVRESLTLYAQWEVYWAIGDIGPGEGMVFYDKGYYGDGWRYMEITVGKINPGGNLEWAGYESFNDDPRHTDSAIGSGYANTYIALAQDTFIAAKTCRDYSTVVDGLTYDDWFLPSKDELGMVHANLISPHRLTVETNSNAWWTSTREGVDKVVYMNVWSSGRFGTTGWDRAGCTTWAARRF